MLSVSRLPLAAPGVYRAPEVPLRALTGVRMDVCGFAGIAPRGPARVPLIDEYWPDDRPCVEPERPIRRTVAVAVESFDEYRRLFGGFEGPGLLPYAVATFFEQGGRRAWIARVVHDYDDAAENAAGVSTGTLPGVTPPAVLRARSEGSWGGRLRASLSFSAEPLRFIQAENWRLTLPRDVDVGAGTLLRLTLPGGARELRFVVLVVDEQDLAAPRTLRRAVLASALPDVPERAEVVEAAIDIDDGDGRRERFERLGLSRLHPRWLATSLCRQSELIWPDSAWAELDLTPDEVELTVPGPPVPQFTQVDDRYAEVEQRDFIDESLLPEDAPAEGVYAFGEVSELAALVVPDLYSPEPLPADDSIIDPASVAGPTFERCVDLPPAAPEQAKLTADLAGLRLDPSLPGDLEQIVDWQNRLVHYADGQRNFVVLLDVPPRLNHRRVLDWRAAFDSSYAAAYHPWLTAARRDDSRERLVRVPPSAVAAGIIARTEIAFGVPHGPANALAREVVNVDERVAPRRHDELHPLGINVYLEERDGVRLTAARTLSRDASWRQLSVRRLMIMLRRVLERQTQWVVFEPNGRPLRARLRQLLDTYLRRLYRAGAFRGATEEEAFFVRCDDVLNPRQVIDAGQLIAEIGVAPAEPLEYIVLRLARDGDGTLTVEE
jgi:uncharacterized protein